MELDGRDRAIGEAPRRGGGVASRRASRARVRSRSPGIGRSRSRWCTRTVTSSSSTSPRASSCIRERATPAGTLVHGLVARFPEMASVGDPSRPGIVHRLDKGTSGLLVVARSQDAYRSLVAQMSSHSVERRYAALVWGRPEPATGVIDAPVGRSTRDPTRMTVSSRGRARAHALQGGARLPNARDGQPARVPARDRTHASGAGAPLGDPPPGRRRQSLRRDARADPRAAPDAPRAGARVRTSGVG